MDQPTSANNQKQVKQIPNWILFTVQQKNERIYYVHPNHLKKVLTYLKDHMNCRLKTLIDVCGTDYPSRQNTRFEVVYQLLSVDFHERICIKTVGDGVCAIDSVTDLFCSAGWFEREVWDMYGVAFQNHPDLRRILTDYGFQGHPLRKDYPLTGYYEVRYDDTQKRVLSEPIEFDQEFRFFDFSSPWK